MFREVGTDPCSSDAVNTRRNGGVARGALLALRLVVIYRICYTLAMTPGQLIRATRRRHGLSQARLALRTGTKQPAISRLEHDELSPSVETLELLLNAMGEQLSLASTALIRDYDPLHRRAQAGRSFAERLALALSWNRLASQLGEAGRRARSDG